MTSALKTASSRPGRRYLPRSSLGSVSFISSPLASGASIEHHPEQVDARRQQVVRRLAGEALGSAGGVDDEQDPVEAAEEVRGPQHPSGHGRVEQYQVPALLQRPQRLRNPFVLEQDGGVLQYGAGRDDEQPGDDLVPVVLQGPAVVEAAGEADEVGLADHAVQPRVFEVAVNDGGPPAHPGEGGAEAEADAGAPGAGVGTGDDDGARPLYL